VCDLECMMVNILQCYQISLSIAFQLAKYKAHVPHSMRRVTHPSMQVWISIFLEHILRHSSEGMNKQSPLMTKNLRRCSFEPYEGKVGRWEDEESDRGLCLAESIFANLDKIAY
jgi:hypothetical protein